MLGPHLIELDVADHLFEAIETVMAGPCLVEATPTTKVRLCIHLGRDQLTWQGSNLRVSLGERALISSVHTWYEAIEPGIREIAAALKLCALHASAIRWPDSSVSIFVGPRSSGKSTTGVALAIYGCDLISDDTVYLGRDRTKTVIISLPRELHVPREECASWPETSVFSSRPDYHPNTGRVAVKIDELESVNWTGHTKATMVQIICLNAGYNIDTTFSQASKHSISNIMRKNWLEPKLKKENSISPGMILQNRFSAWRLEGWPYNSNNPNYPTRLGDALKQALFPD